MIAQASSRVLITKSLNAFFSMSANQQDAGQPRKTAVFGEGPGRKCKRGRRLNPSPAFRGRGGARREAVGGEGLYTRVGKTLTSQAFGLGPSSPVRTGEGLSFQLHPGRRVVARLFPRPRLAVDSGRLQPLRRGRVE